MLNSCNGIKIVCNKENMFKFVKVWLFFFIFDYKIWFLKMRFFFFLYVVLFVGLIIDDLFIFFKDGRYVMN